LQKDKCNMKSAKHVGSAILSWSKVLMLDFVYNCLYQHYDRSEVDLLYTDTDSIYMQVGASSYEEFKQRFPDHLQKLHFAAAGDIIPGKMKLECELREAVFVKPKTYSYVKKDGKEDVRNKGVVLSQNKEILIFDSYKRAVFSARVNIGMNQLKTYLQCTQDQLKTHLTSHFDLGMSLMNYGVLWNLGHTSLPLFEHQANADLRKQQQMCRSWSPKGEEKLCLELRSDIKSFTSHKAHKQHIVTMNGANGMNLNATEAPAKGRKRIPPR
ncbi:hypothetical protein PROFUN_13639, partial [Planoprotostelium fungivorum]